MASNWAIVIGINQYRFLQPLKYAKRDAEAISGFLAQEAKFDRVFLFTDDSPAIGGKPTEPFRANLLRVLRQIFAAPFMKDGDNFWFFFSGHGIPHNGQDYLMPLDGDPEDIENTGISTNTITNYLRSCGADNAVMILDACRSGGKKAGEGIGKQTESEARQTGVISLFSCSPDQYSYELKAIEQGAFTHALLEGLGIRGRCATVERLNQYLEHRVPELVSQYLGRVRQTPYTIAEPLNRAHLILMPQHASLNDIATLKNDAYRAQVNQNWDLAQQLWIRVLAAASGRDMEAIEALQRIAVAKASGTVPIQPQPQPTKSPAQPKSPSPQRLQQNPPLPQRPTSTDSIPPSSNTPKNPVGAGLADNPSPSPQRPRQNPPLPQPSTTSPMTRRKVLWFLGLSSVGIATSIAINISQTENQQPPTPSPSEISPALATTPDYPTLEGLLQAQQWREADQETRNLILSVAGRTEEGWLDSESIQNFPCEVLVAIDELWVNHSNGRFGFSVQRKIWEEVGSPTEYNAQWAEFGDRVGWRKDGSWLSYSDLQFNAEISPPGKLPLCGWSGALFGDWLVVFFSCNDL